MPNKTIDCAECVLDNTNLGLGNMSSKIAVDYKRNWPALLSPTYLKDCSCGMPGSLGAYFDGG